MKNNGSNCDNSANEQQLIEQEMRQHQPPTPNKYAFGAVKVGEKGQIVIPKEARDVFNITAGDQLFVFGDTEQGLALVKAETISRMYHSVVKNRGNKQ